MNTQVLLYYPNLIGYVRVILLIWSLFVEDPIRSMSIYGISCFLDALDGFAARYFDQHSPFGAALDMVTDRSSTGTLLVRLAMVYPKYAAFPMILAALDLSSHYMHMNASLYAGKASHKHVEGNWLLMMYYTKRPVLFLVCALNETCLISLFLMSTPEISKVATIVMMVTLPILVLKQVLNVLQMLKAAADLTRATVVKKKK